MGITSAPHCSISLPVNVSHRMFVKMSAIVLQGALISPEWIFKYHKSFNLMLLQLHIRTFARVTEGC